ncbi:uncharacterized protein [Palaemon carinicauda]|uniref:uncharacterized protein n=1 Tax=Palaemon carinicauda TaxID=392227 RepID=UPI0035B6A7AA
MECAYALQTGCAEEEKDTFWKEMDQELGIIPAGERVIIGGDLNGLLGINLTHITQIKDSNGIVLAEENEIKRRWETYFEGLLNEENPRTVFEDGLPNETFNIGVTRREVEQTVKMKNSKATGPDNIPVEVWKSLGEEGIDILWDLMQKIFNQEKMPEEWRKDLVIPIYKGKGDI